MKRLIPLCLLLASCNEAPDGYKFEKKEFSQSKVQVELITLTEDQFKQERLKRKLPEDVAAFSVLKKPFTSCKVYLIDPTIKYEPQYLGHEISHCFFGRWHS